MLTTGLRGREIVDAGSASPGATATAVTGSSSTPPDDRSFVTLVDDDYRSVVAAVAMILGNTASAEEITQDAFERAYARWNRVGRLDRPGAWVRRVALNGAISAARKRSSERRALDRAGRIDTGTGGNHGYTTRDTVDLDGDAASLWSAVRALPANQARAVALHYGADLSVEMVASEMDTTVPAVKSLLHRARVTLRNDRTVKELEEYRT